MQAFRKFLYSLTLILFGQQIHAQGACEQWLGKLASAQGKVEIRRAGSPNWRPVMRGERYCDMDAIRTGRNSRAVVMLNTDASNRTLTNINQNTFLTFKSLLGGEPNALDLLIDLLKGGALFRSRQPNRLGIETPYINAAHRGTEFFVRVDADQTLVTVYDGQVATSNTRGKLTIDKGETALAKSGKAPVKYALVRPRDAVQWALNYPPVIDYHAASSTPSHPAIGDALSAYRRGDVLEALAILEKVPEAQREPDYYTTKAGLLLSVGRVDEATPAIERALTLDSKNATAFALKSVIAVAQNRNDEAMQLAERAAELEPESPTPQVALSYAHQAKFELEKALESAEKAVELGSGNALALSRLSELQLSMGDLDEALEAAEKATAIDPDLARTQTVLGFAYLTKIDIDEARQTFEKAIELDQAAPLPHLGLGLAKIRKGELKNGTDEFEIAASLDPDNSLIRSYLGKAFYEKKENILAGTELEIAKELDPNDPTPWFYDAIRKQTTNRPVEALHDLQKAIDLNDNRAVYRSSLLLDQDEAARGTSLARIYDNLGFKKRALVEGAKTLSIDPANHSAHRFLSETYAGLPRNNISSVSELLQAQLLQPINTNPIQPRLTISDPNIIASTGPADISFNEFTPIFERNRAQLFLSGLLGNNNTWGEETVLSGIYDRFSFSVGQLHSDTDGFRANNDLKNELYNVFGQVAVTPKLNLQGEYRRRETNQGDLALNFDRENFSPTDRLQFKEDMWRIGVHATPTPQSDFIGSLIHIDAKSVLDQTGFFVINEKSDTDGYDAQGQFLYRTKLFNLVVGGGATDIESTQLFTFDGDPDPPNKSKIDQRNAYAYVNVDLFKNMVWTLGASYESFDQDPIDIDEVNYKAGLQWNLSDHIRLRAATYETVKRALPTEQTIEPVSVAGFPQFFDDVNGTKAKHYGVGIDAIFGDGFYGGIEAIRREVKEPTIGINEETEQEISEFIHRDEDSYSGYMYWTPHNEWALNIEPRYEVIRRKFTNPTNPTKLKTITVPAEIQYFNSNGFFAKLGATYVQQYIDFDSEEPASDNDDEFVIVDAEVGYRLPKRRGIASLKFKNLNDKKTNFQDLQYITASPRNGIINPNFIPDRSILASFILAF